MKHEDEYVSVRPCKVSKAQQGVDSVSSLGHDITGCSTLLPVSSSHYSVTPALCHLAIHLGLYTILLIVCRPGGYNQQVLQSVCSTSLKASVDVPLKAPDLQKNRGGI